jgi:hypothetical protein
MFEKIDDWFKGAEEFLHLPKGITTRQMVPELIGGLADLPIDAVMTDVTAAKIAKGVLGIVFALTPQWWGPAISGRGPNGWTDRDTEDVFAIAKKWIIDVLDPNPSDLVKIANALQNLRMGVTFSDPRRIMSVFGTKTPQQIMQDWTNVANAFGAAFGMPGMGYGVKKPAGDPSFSPGQFFQGLTRSTLSTPGAGITQPETTTPTAVPGISSIYRSTLNSNKTNQPTTPRVTQRYRSSLS